MLGVALGINITSAASPEAAANAFGNDVDMAGPARADAASDRAGAGAEKRQGEDEEMKDAGGVGMEELSEEEFERRRKKEEAAAEKEKGTAAYKKKEFEQALEHYTKAFELDDTDITYLTNRAAVYLEMGKVRWAGVDWGEGATSMPCA